MLGTWWLLGQPNITSGFCFLLKEEHERLLQAAVEQAEGLQCDLRSAEAALADGAARLKDAQVSAGSAGATRLLGWDFHGGILNLKPPVCTTGPTLQEQTAD